MMKNEILKEFAFDISDYFSLIAYGNRKIYEF